MEKIPEDKRPPHLESTPDGVCREIGEYFFKNKLQFVDTQKPTDDELADDFLSFSI